MSDSTANLIPFSDEVIRGFFLGRLSPAEQTQFEELFIADDRLDERASLVEFQLADDFAQQQMDQTDRQRFMNTFMVTGARQRMLAVSDAMQERFSPGRKSESRRWDLSGVSLRHFFIFNRPAWRLAFGVLILLFLISSLWLVIKEPQIVKHLLPKRVTPRPAATSTPQETHHPTNSEPPIHRRSDEAPPAHESSLPNTGDTAGSDTLTIALSSASAQGAQPSIANLSGTSTRVVRFQVAVDSNQSGVYRAAVERLDGQSVFAAEVQNKAGAVEFDVSAGLLPPGDYQIRLMRAEPGGSEVARYYFGVR